MKRVLFILLIAFAFIPIMVQIGAFVEKMTGFLQPMGQEGVVMAFGLSSASALVFVFGLLYVLSVYFFAQDVSVLLALPLRPWEILFAKFCTTLVYEYISAAVFLGPLFVAFGLKTSAGTGYVFASAAVFFLLPVAPLAMASAVMMGVMLFTDFSKNRDRFGKIAGTLTLVAVIGLNYFLQRNTGMSDTPERLSEMLAQGRPFWAQGLGRMFPGTRWAADAVLQAERIGGWISLALFLSLSMAAVSVLLAVGEKLYLHGVHGRARQASRQATAVRTVRDSLGTAGSATRGIFLKDMRILFRDPAFFMNCIIMNFLWPFFLFIFSSVGPGQNVARIAAFLTRTFGTGLLMALAAAFGMLITATNAISSTAISREGKALVLAKHVPVSYSRQLLAKAMAAAAMGAVGSIMVVLLALFVFHLPLRILPHTVVLLLLGIVFSALTGVWIDLLMPKLNWDNSYKAVKQNLNVPVHMAINAVAAGIFIVCATRFRWSSAVGFYILTALLVAADLALYRLLTKTGAEVLSRIEI